MITRDPRTDPQPGDVVKDVSNCLKPGYVNEGFKFAMTCRVTKRDGDSVTYENTNNRPDTIPLGQWIFWARNAVILTVGESK